MVNHLSVLVQGVPPVQLCVFACFVDKLNDFRTKFVRNSYEISAFPNPSKATRNMAFSSKKSKGGSILANIRTPFKRPLIPGSRRVNTGANVWVGAWMGGLAGLFEKP